MKQSDLNAMLIALSEHGLQFDAPATTDPVGDAGMAEPSRQAYYPPHQHTHLEIICLLEGSLALYLNGRWQSWQSSQPRVLVPGTSHSERYADRHTGYRMIWVTLFPSALFLHLTSYHPLVRYATSTNRMAIAPPMVSKLWRLSRQPDFHNDALNRAHFHAWLMECLQYALLTPGGADRRPEAVRDRIVEQVKEYVCQNYQDDLSLERMASLMHYSKGHLNSLFRKIEHISLHRFVNEIRLRKAHALLTEGDLMVKQVALAAGFQDPLYFSRLFRRRFGKRPTDIHATSHSPARPDPSPYVHPVGDAISPQLDDPEATI